MTYDRSVTTDERPKGGWRGLFEGLGPFVESPLVIFLPLVLMALFAFWVYVWITRKRRSAGG